MDKCKIIIWLLLIFVMGGSLPLAAQDDYDPTPPDEPTTPVFPEEPETKASYAVVVTANDPLSCSVSGGGSYEEGSVVQINASARSTQYIFSHWTKNGVVTSLPQSFSYTVSKAEDGVIFVAHFAFDPISPDEPASGVTSRLFLESNMEGACSFSRANGALSSVDSDVEVTVYPNQNYTFEGWYNGEELVSTDETYTFTMPYHNVTLTAHFSYHEPEPEPEPEYDPDVPGEPGTAEGQGTVVNYKIGDPNNDGEITMADIMYVVNYLLGSPASDFNEKSADTTQDGNITMADVMYIVQYLLTNKFPSE